MLLNPINEDQIKNIVDYIYLIRYLKFSKKGVITLFKNPTINISQFTNLSRERIEHFLYMGKKQKLLFDNNFDKLFKFDYSDKKYNEVFKIVNYCYKNNIDILTPNSKYIPLLFQNLKDTLRDIIFMKGNIIEEDCKSYSICGTRNPTKDAIFKTYKIGEFFAEKGFTLINGFAKGIDIEAFKGAKGKSGRYIGVLASGVEEIYPPENSKFIKDQ